MTEERNYEQEARQEGWRPQEEWSGDPEKWVDEKTFVERGEKISGILKSKLERVEQRLEKAERANAKFGEYHKQTIEKERKGAEARIHQLESLLAEAVDNGDGQTFTKLNREIDNLKSNMPAPPVPEVSFDPIEGEWLQKNPWYGKDPQLTAMADGVTGMVEAEGYNGKARLDEIQRRVEAAFPEKFKNPNKGKEDVVGSGSPVEDAPIKKASYKNMDKEAKDACDDFVSQGFMTQDEYVEQYFSEEE
jgi:hypothetical protein